MKQVMVVVVAALGLAGCEAMETGASFSQGLMRVEPHPMHADSARVVMMGNDGGIALDPLGRQVEANRVAVARGLVADRCPDAPVIAEGAVTVQIGGLGRRTERAYRVVCPAARQ